jgi:hypothetical protein
MMITDYKTFDDSQIKQLLHNKKTVTVEKERETNEQRRRRRGRRGRRRRKRSRRRRSRRRRSGRRRRRSRSSNPPGGGELTQGMNRQAHGSTRALTSMSSVTELHYDQVLLHVKQPPLLQLH